jgi:sugar phosphate isomerase/epimerase
MQLSLSTRWNACRHQDGESMLWEILDLGFAQVELGYDLRLELVPGVRDMVARDAVSISSVHNFCPVPVGAPMGHPELFLLADTNERARESAVNQTTKTVQFAAEVGASRVVVHAGRVRMPPLTHRLIALCESGKQFQPRYERIRTKLMLKRLKKANRHLAALRRSLDELLPELTERRVCLAMENLPSWEAIPSEAEMEQLSARYDPALVGFWNDIGHGQVRENLGFINQLHWLQRLRKCVAGMHIHDVEPVAMDHLMPPRGRIDFSTFKPHLDSDMALVLEPAPGTPVEEVAAAKQHLETVWGL